MLPFAFPLLCSLVTNVFFGRRGRWSVGKPEGGLLSAAERSVDRESCAESAEKSGLKWEMQGPVGDEPAQSRSGAAWKPKGRPRYGSHLLMGSQAARLDCPQRRRVRRRVDIHMDVGALKQQRLNHLVNLGDGRADACHEMHGAIARQALQRLLWISLTRP